MTDEQMAEALRAKGWTVTEPPTLGEWRDDICREWSSGRHAALIYRRVVGRKPMICWSALDPCGNRIAEDRHAPTREAAKAADGSVRDGEQAGYRLGGPSQWPLFIQALGLRWVAACKARGVEAWRPGMLTADGQRVCAVLVDGAELFYAGVAAPVPWDDEVPDFRDPSTLGAALGAVREVWGDERINTHRTGRADGDGKWGVGVWERGSGWALSAIVLPAMDSEAEALIAAMEAAP